ncbi:MAG: Gfo/Idh/MocA family oxidoreductase [Chloroflexi bacterium]|nr:Gfo/Idh/MocA family oxidoreductase [Chloroflexota bacterium]
MTTLRYGILGSGFMGRTHAEAIRHLPNAALIAVAGGSRAAGLAADYSATLCASDEELLARTDVDAVIIATPQFAHARQALAAADRDKHLFIEKPMTTTVADAEAIIDACARRGLALSVGYQQRYRDVPMATRAAIRAGTIGAVQTIQFFQVFQRFVDPAFGGDWSWWSDPASVGHILAGGVHAIDLCRWLLGAEVTTVFGHSRTFREHHEPENTTMGLLTFGSGTLMALWASSACPAPGFPGLTFRAMLTGETGLLDMDAYTTLRVAEGGAWRTLAEQPPVGTDQANTAFSFPRMHAYVAQLGAFTDAVLAGTPPPVTGEDGRTGVAVALAFLESSRSGRQITLRA